jgi:hypothetical protein
LLTLLALAFVLTVVLAALMFVVGALLVALLAIRSLFAQRAGPRLTHVAAPPSPEQQRIEARTTARLPR